MGRCVCGGGKILETEIGRLGPTNRVWKVYAEENDPCQCHLLGYFRQKLGTQHLVRKPGLSKGTIT